MRTLMAILTTSALDVAAADTVPDWRGQAPGTAWLGPDILWRCREGLVFHLLDEKGAGFRLDVAVRDMNTYQQGPRPVLVWLLGPDGETVFRDVLPDDGVVSGNEQYRDGMADMYLDCRYREWHRLYSSGGTPPGKKRSPFLDEPEALMPRQVPIQAPAAGAGLYRLVIVASWDHWISVSADTPLRLGVHPGPGPLYVHRDRLQDCWFYAPSTVKDIGFAITEEIQPFNWRARVEDETGAALVETAPQSFMSYAFIKTAKPGLHRLRLTGTTTGACLHMGGVPMLLCPDADTARAFHGGCDVDAKGRATFHPWPRTIHTWVDGLGAEDLDVRVEVDPARLPKEVAGVPETLAAQILDPQDPRYGQFRTDLETFRPKVDDLARAAGWKDERNPYYGNAALVWRVLLCRSRDIATQTPYFWYGGDGPRVFEFKEDVFWCLPFRSNWYPMHDGMHASSLHLMKGVVAAVLPPAVLAAWRASFLAWVGCRHLMHQGECSNQWAVGLAHMCDVWDVTREPSVEALLRYQIERFVTPGSLGRANPDPDPYSWKSGTGYGYDCDIGTTGAGYPADGMGHDSEYCLESELHLGRVWQSFPDPRLIDWFRNYYVLKTHLTLPKWGVPTTNAFGETCSPSDANFRTQCYTHKSPVPDDLRPRFRYGLLWGGKDEPGVTWPCLETEPFVRSIDNKFHFLNTPGYYAILYAGPVSPHCMNLGRAKVRDGAARLVGYSGMHYGGTQWKATKAGGLSAVFVRGCGPVLLSQNCDVMYSNVVWVRLKTPICEVWEEGQVDPTLTCSGFAHPYTTFDAGGRVYRKIEDVPYAPLQVARTIALQDDRIAVTVEILATATVDVAEIWEAIPYVVDRRLIRVYAGADLAATEYTPPAPVWMRQGRHEDQKAYWMQEPLPAVSFRAVDVAAASGAGAALVFDRDYAFRPSRPIRYRDVAAAVGSFSLPLNPRMQAGERQVVRYVILTHATALTPESLTAAAP